MGMDGSSQGGGNGGLAAAEVKLSGVRIGHRANICNEERSYFLHVDENENNSW